MEDGNAKIYLYKTQVVSSNFIVKNAGDFVLKKIIEKHKDISKEYGYDVFKFPYESVIDLHSEVRSIEKDSIKIEVYDL